MVFLSILSEFTQYLILFQHPALSSLAIGVPIYSIDLKGILVPVSKEYL